MSDYWSGIFLFSVVVLAFFLFIIVLFTTMLRKKKRYLNVIVFGTVATLLFIWVADRFIVGSFCLPWECVKRGVDVEFLLLNRTDLPDDWSVRQTFNYAYVPRASSAYVERTFHSDSKFLNKDFFQEIYQYRSVRGASFQYNAIKHDLPRQYSYGNDPLSPQVNLQINHATAYIIECLYSSQNICYYIAQYEEFVIVLEMPFSNSSVPIDDFINIIRLADEKFFNAFRDSDVPSP